MSSINKQISFMFMEYSAAFHMKYKLLFADTIYDSKRVDTYPLVITWAELEMAVEAGNNNKCLAVATKTDSYEDNFKVTEEFFEDALQAFFLFPHTKDDNEDSSKLRLEFVKALLNK